MAIRLGKEEEEEEEKSFFLECYEQDGQKFFEMEYNIQSIASENEFAPLPSQRPASVEWDRRFFEVSITHGEKESVCVSCRRN